MLESIYIIVWHGETGIKEGVPVILPKQHDSRKRESKTHVVELAD
jgi:hypothetical protein